MIERYLCVGGVEIANPCRTLAYMANVGNRCQPTVRPAVDCCCCPDWLPRASTCSVTLTLGIWATGTEVCAGIFGAEGDIGDVVLLELATYAVDPCGGPRPATPDPGDPGWVVQFTGPLPADLLGMFGACSAELFPSDPDTPTCSFARYTITTTAGQVISFLAYIDYSQLTNEDVGPAGFSLDGGLTWATGEQVHTWAGDCGGEARTYTAIMLAEADESEVCTGMLALVGGIGPYSVDIRFFPTGGPPDPGAYPTDDDPGWVSLGSGGPFVTMPPLGQCNPYGFLPDDGFYVFTVTDLGAGNVIEFASAIAFSLVTPGNHFTGSVFRFTGSDWATYPTSGIFGQVISLGPPATVFTNPADDDAPWYDVLVPESSDVLGVWIEEATLSNPHQRTMTETLRGGALGARRLGPRELSLTGWVYTRSKAATAYARQWLYEALAGSACGDGAPDAQLWTYCDHDVTDAGKRTLKRVGLLELDPEAEPDFPEDCGLKFTATLSAEVPELFLEPQLAALVELDEDHADVFCNICSPCPTPNPAPCACGPLATPPRAVPETPAVALYCEPVQLLRTCTSLEPPALWRDATAIIRIHAGDWPGEPDRAGVSNLRLRGWINPAGLPAPTEGSDLFQCQDPCLSVEVGCIPAGAELVIDGTTRRAVVRCKGEDQNAFAYLSSSGGGRFTWPDIACYGLMVCAEGDAANTAPGTTVSIEVVPRERG